MKLLIISTFLFFSLASFGQVATPIYGTQKFTGDVIFANNDTVTKPLFPGAMRYKSSNSTFYKWDGSAYGAIGGASSIITTTAGLRAISNLPANTAIITNDLGNGVWKVRAGDVSSTDNGYTLVVTPDGKRVERIYSGAIDARWSGVVGDGVTDNTAILQALINFAGATNQEIYLPDGVYLTDKLYLVSNLKIRGQSREGTRIKQKTSPAVIDAYSAVFYSSGNLNNLKLENFTIDANQNNFGDGTGLSSARGQNRGLYVLNLGAACGNYVFNNMKFVNCYNSVLLFALSNTITNAVFDKCLFDSSGESSILPQGVINLKFINSEIKGWGLKDTTTGQSSNSCAVYFKALKSDNVFFDNNRITNTNGRATFAISNYSSIGGTVNSTFSNNVIDGGSTGGSGFSMSVENTVFSHNMMLGKGLYTSDGFEVSGNKVSIINNTITNGGLGLVGVSFSGKYFGDGWIVQGNQINSLNGPPASPSQPIVFIGGAASTPIKNMLFSNNILNSSTATDYIPGIILGAYGNNLDANDITIINNTIKVNSAGSVPAVQIKGLDTVFNININKNIIVAKVGVKIDNAAILGNITVSDNDFSGIVKSTVDSTFLIVSGTLDGRFKITGNTYNTNLKALSLSKNTFIMSGTGAPETVITGNPGSTFIDEATGNNYRKSTGTGNTGWALQVNGAVTKVAPPLSVRVIDSTLIADTVSTTKTGVLMSGYRTNSGDTLATKADVRAGGGSITETDPVVKAINGVVKSNGTTIAAAVAGTDYVIPSGSITGNAGGLSANITESQVTNLVSDLSSKQATITFPNTATKYHTGYNTFSVLNADSITNGINNKIFGFDLASSYTIAPNNNLSIISTSTTIGTPFGLYFVSRGSVGAGQAYAAAIVGKVGVAGANWFTGTGLAFKTNPGPDVTANSAIEQVFINPNGNMGIGSSVTVPTAVLQIKAGTATATTAPLKLTSGVNLTTPEDGAVEYDGTDLYFTPGNASRYKIQKVITAGSALNVGTSTLVAGTVTVSTTAALTGSKIFVTVVTPGGARGFLSVPTITNATSFVITSTSTTETSTVNWWIVN